MRDTLLDHLPKNLVLQALRSAPGQEIERGKLDSPESSAALAANLFGYFLDKPGLLPPLPDLEDGGWPARDVRLEAEMRFPWAGGRHPWLDALIETGTHLIGVESKRFEPFRGGRPGSFSDAFRRSVWGPDMGPYEALRDGLAERRVAFRHLDAVQLVKHALGLRTQALRRGLRPVLVYAYAEPRTWPDGRAIAETVRSAHLAEIVSFAHAVAGAEVRFLALSHERLLDGWSAWGMPEVSRHAAAVRAWSNGAWSSAADAPSA
jgi:hypothetical protein